MKALVIGGGSIGTRHLQNLRALGVEELGLVETDAGRRSALRGALSLETFADLSDGLEGNPDFVVVATPTHLHVEQALEIVRCDFPAFVEKPLSHTDTRVSELAELVERRNLVSLVGCNMRFHPGPKKVKELLQEERLGRLLFARLHCGSFLPGWRPGTDYRNNYAAREATGGGCILDCIHEIDLARWFLGEVREVACLAGHLSSLEIETEDVAALICRHETGALSEIHLDYVQKTYERGCQIVGEEGTVFWDFSTNQVRWFHGASGEWTTFLPPEGWQLNQMYLDEMEHFVDCVRSGRQTIFSIPEAAAVMQIAFAAKASAREGRLVSTGREVPA